MAITAGGSLNLVPNPIQATLSSNYNMRPTIAEIMVSGSTHKIIRKRQSLQNLVKN